MQMKREKVLETILVLVLAFVVFYWIFRKDYLLIAGFIVGAIGLFIPWLAEKIHWLWNKLSHILGAVMSKVILTVVYVLVLLPLAFLSKLSGKQHIQLKPGSSSYFKVRNKEYTKESMEHPW